MSRLPDEKIATARALRAKGHSIREVGALAGIAGLGSIHAYVKGIQPPFGPLKPGRKKKIAFNVCKALQDQGLNYRQIAQLIGCAHSAVYNTLKTGKSAA